MRLIPPSHGEAYVRTLNSPEYLQRVGEGQIRETMVQDLDRVFQTELGVPAPRPWLQWETLDRPEHELRELWLRALAPTSSRTVWLVPRNEARVLQVPATTQSRVPLVQKPYRYEDPFDRPDRYLTFKGWHPESGLMAFDRQDTQ